MIEKQVAVGARTGDSALLVLGCPGHGSVHSTLVHSEVELADRFVAGVFQIREHRSGINHSPRILFFDTRVVIDSGDVAEEPEEIYHAHIVVDFSEKNPAGLKVGDKVRMLKFRDNVFDKASTEKNWTKNVYTIVAIEGKSYIIENSKELLLDGNEGGSTGTNYSHYVIVNRAKQFIRENKDKPFFCYLPITPPHGIFDIPDDDPAWKLYKDKPWSEPARRYAAMVSMVDRQVGEIEDLLKELKLDKNTIVFFSGDNGGNDYFTDKDHPRGFHGANIHPTTGVEFRGRKGAISWEKAGA